MELSNIDILERLVAFPTVSSETNLPLIDWVREYLADQGIHSHIIHDATGHKGNLFASIGPQVEDGLVLSGHTDVVPVDGQEWNTDPFKLTAEGSRLYGRGACDMKGFMAVVLSQVPAWKALRLSRPVHLMFSYDEEVGCVGAPTMIEAAREALPRPAAVFVGEPTEMRVANEHKGLCRLLTRIKGVEAHSSLTHRGVSAVMLAASLISHLRKLSGQFAARRCASFSRFEPPYTTLSVNCIEGGTAVNILAASSEFSWEIRALPDEMPSAVLDSLASYAAACLEELGDLGKACSVHTQIVANAPALRADSGTAEQLAQGAASMRAEPIAVPFATEAGQFQEAGWPTIVCGPGSIDQAHKPNEFVDRSQLAACSVFLDRAVAQQCT